MPACSEAPIAYNVDGLRRDFGIFHRLFTSKSLKPKERRWCRVQADRILAAYWETPVLELLKPPCRPT